MRAGVSTLPASFSEALRLAADTQEALEQAKIERDQAVATKAEIGTRREATAMARASFEKRRADQLEQELGSSTNWKAVKSVDWVPVLFDTSISGSWAQIGKYFKRLSDELNVSCNEIEDTRFGKVKAYHIDVITEAYKRIKEDESVLHKYRAIKEGAA